MPERIFFLLLITIAISSGASEIALLLAVEMHRRFLDNSSKNSSDKNTAVRAIATTRDVKAKTTRLESTGSDGEEKPPDETKSSDIKISEKIGISNTAAHAAGHTAAAHIAAVSSATPITWPLYLTMWAVTGADHLMTAIEEVGHPVAAVKDTNKVVNPHQTIFVSAEMDSSVIVERFTNVEVTVSGKHLKAILGASCKSGSITVDKNKTVLVQAIGKERFSVEGKDRCEITPPDEDQELRLYFDLRATELGDGEIWIVFFESQMPLLTLSLKSKVVSSRAETKLVMASSLMAQPAQPAKVEAQGVTSPFPDSSDPIHQLRIIENNYNGQIVYCYDFQSPTLGLLGSFRSHPISGDRKKYVANIYQEIEARWVSNAEDAEAFNQELRAFGGSLFDELFPNELKALLWKHRQGIKSIMVLSSEPFIPWELIHLKEPGQTSLPDETIFLAQMGLVRWLFNSSGGYPPQQIKMHKGEAAYLIPRYPDPDIRLPKAEEEADFLEHTFDAERLKPNSKSLRDALHKPTFKLFHFAGHGIAEQDKIGNSKLMMEGRMNGKRYIHDLFSATTASQYSRLLTSRPMIVLNACQVGREGYTLTGIGGFAEAFLKGGAGAFVGPLWSVGDSPAKLFTETLYDELIAGNTLSEAANRARQTAQAAGKSTWLAYAVYGHPNMKLTLFENPTIPLNFLRLLYRDEM